MSDDTKACQTPLIDLLRSVPSDARQMIERGPCHHQNIPYGRLCTEAADTVERLQRDRDALAERCEKLREALRRNAVKDGYCAECSERPDWRTWVGTNPERHAEGCLAAPKDAP